MDLRTEKKMEQVTDHHAAKRLTPVVYEGLTRNRDRDRDIYCSWKYRIASALVAVL